jgi:hypothetical protein
MISPQKHKEELPHRQELDNKDRKLVCDEFDKYPHPFEVHQDHLINVTGQTATSGVNVADAVEIGAKMETDFINKLPDGFHNPLSSQVKTMEVLKMKTKANKSTLNLETIFLRNYHDWSTASHWAQTTIQL